jgi:hypothetical protein
MAFIDNNNILVLEKGGQVRLVSNGVLQDKPVLQVSVDTTSERGLLGIAIVALWQAFHHTSFVVLLLTSLQSQRPMFALHLEHLYIQ